MVKTADIEVTLLDHMGSDLTVVNAARVSFDKGSDWNYWRDDDGEVQKYLKDADKNIIRFLATGMQAKDRGKLVDEVMETHDSMPARDLIQSIRDTSIHFSPFTHCMAQFRIKIPIFVARQVVRHRIGSDFNEVSRRYVDSEPEFYIPAEWRLKAPNVKQGSSKETITRWPNTPDAFPALAATVERQCADAVALYEDMMTVGVAPEMARMVLPLNTMTEWVWTGSLYFFARFCKGRLDPHAQEETAIVARKVAVEMEKLFPNSWKSLMNWGE